MGLGLLAVAAVRGKLRRYIIAEHSMEPTLDAGDWVVAQRISKPPKRSDIVIFKRPGMPGMELTKRVIGLPGEHVAIDNGQVHIDGVALAEPWADGPTMPEGEWSLGPQDTFVLGDARAVSGADSRTLGPIPLSEISWRVVYRYWPAGSLGRV